MPVLSFNDNANRTPHDLAVKAVTQGRIRLVAQCQRDWTKEMPEVIEVVKAVTGALQLPLRFSKIVHAAAALAAEPNENIYHGNRHFLEVFLLAATLGNHAWREGRIDDRDFGNLLAAALVHDYHHDGKTNGSWPLRLETMTCDDSAEALRAAGADDEDLADIRACVYATDASFGSVFADLPSAADMLKERISGKDLPMYPGMEPLYDPQKAEIAQILQDADVGTSLLAKDLADKRSQDLAQERGLSYDPKEFGFFLQVICHWRMFSVSGSKLIQPFMDKTIKDCGFTKDAALYPHFPLIKAL